MTRMTASALEDLEADARNVPSPTSKHAHRCLACRARRSLFRYRGAVKADRDHTLCFRCYRALRDSMRAQWLARAA